MRISTRSFQRLATLAVISFGLLIVTGAVVRLSGSGLGCPDWPSCYSQRLVAADSLHPLIEFTNRLISVVVTVVSATTWLASLRREHRRRDLSWLSFGLVGGVLGQIVLGGLVVLTKLNPYLVALHFLFTLAILADALVLRWRCRSSKVSGEFLVGKTIVWLARAMLGVTTALLIAGTIVSGAGPHSGGKGAKRVPIAFSAIAQLHSDIALFLIGMTLAALFALHQAKVPAVIERRAQVFLEILATQGGLGFTQYFLHDNTLIVEFHVVGATIAWYAMIVLYLSLRQRLPELEDTQESDRLNSGSALQRTSVAT